jgi:hypothetical protein
VSAELCELFEQLIKPARNFACTPNEVLGRSFVSVSQKYVEGSLSLLNLTVPINITGELCTAHCCEDEVLKANIVRAEHMKEFAEELTELVIESNEIDATLNSVVENVKNSP